MDSVHHIWCPLSSQEFQDLPDGAETTLTRLAEQEALNSILLEKLADREREIDHLEEALQGYVLTDCKLHADDTPVPVLLLGNKKTKTGRLWTYVRDDRNAGSGLAPAVWFTYSPDRKGIHPQSHLVGFSGILQADAYARFNELYRNGQITEAACWAHARRKIHDVHVRAPSALTEEALKRIGELYAIEEAIRGLPATERLAARQSRSRPLLISLHEWLVEKSAALSKKSRLGEAFAYPNSVSHYNPLTYIESVKPYILMNQYLISRIVHDKGVS